MLPNQLAGFALLSQETNFYHIYKDPYANPEAGKAIHLIGYLAAPSGADVRSEARSETPLLRYLRNGLELVEMPGGGASGTNPGHGSL